MAIEEIHLRIKAILEVVGKPKEYVENMLESYLVNIKEDETLMVVSQKTNPASESEGVWSTFGEIELVIRGLTNLISFCINYMPSSIEIIKPENFNFEARVFTGFINDILSKLHVVDMMVKKVNTQNTNLLKNMDKIVTNNFLVLLKFGVNTIDKISTATGINEKDVKKFLEKLEKDNRVKSENNLYLLV